MIDDEEVLPGGNMGGAVRVADTVRRPAGPWSPTVQRLLVHLREQGVTWAPAPTAGRSNCAATPASTAATRPGSPAFVTEAASAALLRHR
jgi:hypothetical protein